MNFSPRAADKLTFTGIYLILALLVIWGGGKVVNYAVDFGFYRDFLMPWEVRLIEMRYRSVRVPEFNQDHPVAYMQSVVDLMKANGMQLPQSNTPREFIYRLNRFGSETSQILLVLKGSSIIVYGLPDATFKRLDRFVDGRTDANHGDFTGRLSKDRMTFIGSWKL